MNIIYDTNTICYIHDGGNITPFFSFETHSIFIANELLSREMSRYEDELIELANIGKLKIIKTSESCRTMFNRLTEKYTAGLSSQDLLCLSFAMAEKLDAVATADHQLRNATEKEGLIPLWVLDLVGFLLDEKIFTKADALMFYKTAYHGSEKKFQHEIDKQMEKH